MFPCFEPLMSELYGNGSKGPRASRRPTPWSMLSCSSSSRSFHQEANSSVNSTSQDMTWIEYDTERIQRQGSEPRPFPPCRDVHAAALPLGEFVSHQLPNAMSFHVTLRRLMIGAADHQTPRFMLIARV